MNQIENDTRSTTGRNLKKIMLLVNKTYIKEITLPDLQVLEYCAVDEERVESRAAGAASVGEGAGRTGTL